MNHSRIEVSAYINSKSLSANDIDKILGIPGELTSPSKYSTNAYPRPWRLRKEATDNSSYNSLSQEIKSILFVLSSGNLLAIKQADPHATVELVITMWDSSSCSSSYVITKSALAIAADIVDDISIYVFERTT